MREHGKRFGRRKDHWQLCRARHALDIVDEVEFALEHLLVKKEERSESLVLRGSRYIFLHSEMCEELGDLVFAHLVWVALVVKEDEAPYPIDVRLLGADRIMFHAQMPADAVEQLRRRSDGGCGGRHAEDGVQRFPQWQAGRFGQPRILSGQ